MNTLPFHHLETEFLDSIKEYSMADRHEHALIPQGRAHRALPLSENWPTRRCYVPQGCDQQGRLSASIKPAEPFPAVCDKRPEAFDQGERSRLPDEDQSVSADLDVLLWLLKWGAVVSVALFSAWILAGGPNA